MLNFSEDRRNTRIVIESVGAIVTGWKLNSRCYRARVLFEPDGAIQQHSQRALRAAAASHDAKARARPEHKELGRA